MNEVGYTPGTTPPSYGGSGVALAEAARDRGRPGDANDAARSVRQLAVDLYRMLATQPGNLVFSPYSVAVALAMTREGARGRTAAEMDAVLHATPPPQHSAAMNALTQLVESRAGEIAGALGEVSQVVELDVASSLWGQVGI